MNAPARDRDTPAAAGQRMRNPSSVITAPLMTHMLVWYISVASWPRQTTRKS
jgi:hypothetical protein